MDAKDEIKDRLNIADIISEYLELRPAGMSGYKALCPFHQESSPSFHVSKDKQIWHCFGCGKGGDVFSFVMEMEGLDFRKSLELLAEKAGVDLPDYKKNTQSSQGDHLYDLNELSCKLFETLLHGHDSAQIARDYIVKRGISADMVEKFRLGYAPDGWDKLKKFINKKGYGDDRIQKAGLIKPRSNGQGYIDQFRNRLTVPIRNAKGQVCGFTARALSEDDRGPKYINTPETEIYQKRTLLYGLFEGKSAIRTHDRVIIVEGNLDVISSHQAGIEYVVASSGTALTESQLDELKRYTNNLYFCFDADNAGFNAARRGIDQARQKGFQIHVLKIPQDLGKDPDEVIKKDPQAWAQIIEKPISIMEFYLNRALDLFDVNTVEGKKGFFDMLIPEIASINNLIEKDFWLQKLSDILKTELSTLKQALQKYGRENQLKTIDTISSSVVKNVDNQPNKTNRVSSRKSRLERLLLGIDCSNFPGITPEVKNFDIISSNSHLEIYKVAEEVYSSAVEESSTQKNNLIDQILNRLSDSDKTLLRASMIEAEQMMQGKDQNLVREERLNIISELEKISTEDYKKTLIMSIREAERRGDTDRLKALMNEYQKIIS